MNEILRRSASQNDIGQEPVISSGARNPLGVTREGSISRMSTTPIYLNFNKWHLNVLIFSPAIPATVPIAPCMKFIL